MFPTIRSRHIFNAAVLGLLAVAIFLEFKPYITTPNVRLEEVLAMDLRIETVSAEAVAGLLNGQEKPVLLVLYASWCPVCAQVMPEITQLMRERRLDGVTPVFISLDNQKRELSKYLVYNDYDELFTPTMLESSLVNGLPGVLAAHGSRFAGGIPYVGLFDKEGHLLRDRSGMMTREEILHLSAAARK